MFKFLYNIKIPILLFLDIIVIACSYSSTYYFIAPFSTNTFFLNAAIAVIAYIVVMSIFGVYNQTIRYSSAREYCICAIASACCCTLISLSSFLASKHLLGIKYQIFAGIIIAVGFVAIRVFLRELFVSLQNPIKKLKGKEAKNVLIIGAGYAGNAVIKEVLVSKNEVYNIVGIIDDDKRKKGNTLSGIKVIGNRNKIADTCNEKKVNLILFCIPTCDGKNKKEILDICYKTGKKVKVLPGMNDLIVDKSILKNMRDIDVTDLLSRDPVKLNDEDIKKYIFDKVIMVTGGGGSIGSELCRQIAKYSPKHLIILDIYENNAYDIECELKKLFPQLRKSIVIASVRDKRRLEEVFSKYNPEIIFHAAAHKHVPLMEDNAQEAVKNNIFGTLNVAECADKFGAEKFILISTDKAVNPTNIMGASKRTCEMIIQAINERSKTDFVAVRFGNVLGSNGSVIPLFKKQIESGGPVTVTHKEITRFFMTIPEAAQLVLQAGTFAKGGEIFVLDMGEPVKIYDLAVNMIKLSGYDPGKDIEIEISGLRPGEKLYEELLMSEEGLQSTTNSKIFVAEPMNIDFDELKNNLFELLEIEEKEDNLEIKKKLAEIVPTYKMYVKP